jgi:hypothetical protein
MNLFEQLTQLIFLSMKIETLDIENPEYQTMHQTIIKEYKTLFEITKEQNIDWPLEMYEFEAHGRIPNHKALTKAACTITGKKEQDFVFQMMHQQPKKPSCK